MFDEADAALGFSLSRLCFEGPEAELTLTANAQPAILTTSVAALRVLEGLTGWRPPWWPAIRWASTRRWCAPAPWTLADAVRLVRLRGQFMQDAVPAGQGAMAAILGLEVAAVVKACAECAAATGQVVSPANLNGGGQIVIAGHKAAVDRACGCPRSEGPSGRCRWR